MSRKIYTIESVREHFENEGCKLLSDSYVKCKKHLEYICSCGNKSKITYEKFRIGQRCRECRNRKLRGNGAHTYEFIKKVFEDGGCVLLSDSYKNGKEKLKYQCECGSVSEISYSKFKIGQRCQKCKSRKIIEALSGEKNPAFKKEKTQAERIRDRKYPEYSAWRRQVYERDDYACYSCGEKGGQLNAHHIMAYSTHPDLRTNVSNGVTLCTSCHKEYHSNYYKNDADEESFRMFIRGEHCQEPPNVDNMREDRCYV